MGTKKMPGYDEGACTPKKNAAERIFETARGLFYQRGIRAVGVDEIVCQAGVTKPSLYRAFASKDELVAACLEECARESRETIRQRLEDTNGGAREKLHAVMRHYADMLADPDFRGCPMSNTAVEFPESGNPGRKVAEGAKTEMLELLLKLSRELGVRRPEALADGLLLLLEGAFASHHIFGSQGPSSALLPSADALIDAHLASVPA
jgi:AcrR family transcriptional regulator